ncbi:amidohydrolase [Sediminibacterium sp. KACHI17]|jgi:imidazolonepropionase-like amidohydrolase|uniref:Amidohydrolase n=1 Tax=Sediminibacterium sp. KACHI17 TaxID=1751071 RepID=A0AAT9GK72_9BACT
MKKTLLYTGLLSLVLSTATAQDDVYPAPKQNKRTAITNAVIHVGNGTVIENGTLVFDNGKITYSGAAAGAPSAETIVDAKGKHIYPGIILPASTLGLQEISGVRGSTDINELGELNPSIHSIVAYKAESIVTNTLRANGILLAHVAPGGQLVAGQSSVVQLDAWNYEDAAYKIDNGMHFYMPSLLARPGGGRFAALLALLGPQQPSDPVKAALDRIEGVKAFFREAKAYHQKDAGKEINLKFEATKALFEKKQKLYIHCSQVKQMLVAIDFVKEFGFDVVLVGASDSWQIADLLKQNNIAVILTQEHNLPTLDDDDVDQPYKAATALHKAGVLFCLNDDDPQNRGRNLPFNAGTAAAYGLGKEEALKAITLNAAKILGIDDKTGTLEVGKDANIVISAGDILDMKSSIITNAYIQGRGINLSSKHTQLYERYKHKYGIK